MSLVGAVKARPVQKRSTRERPVEDRSEHARSTSKNGHSSHSADRVLLPATHEEERSTRRPTDNGTLLQTNLTPDALLESIDSPIFTMDRSGRMIACNAAFRELWSGRSFEIGQDMHLFQSGAASLEARKLWRAAFAQAVLGERAQFEQEFDLHSARTKIEFTLNPIRENGAIVGISGVGRMIRVLREDENEAASQNAPHRILFEDIPAPMWIIDPDTLRFVQVNRAAREYYGYTAEEFAEMTLLDIRPPQGHTFSRFMKTERYSHGTWVHAKRDGTVIFMEGISNPIDFDGKPASLALLKDITRHLEAEEALVDANERFRLAAEAVNSLIYEWNIESGIVLRSALLHSLTGYDPSNAETQTLEWWYDRVHPEDRDMLRATMTDATITQQSNFNAEYRIRHRNGHYIYLWDRGLVVHNDEGK